MGFFASSARASAWAACALLPVCANIVEVVDRREEGVHMAGQFKRKRVFGGRDAREGIRSVVADYLSRHGLVRPIGQLREHLYIIVRRPRGAADRNVLNVNHERARIRRVCPHQRLKHLTVRQSTPTLLFGPYLSFLKNVRFNQAVFGRIRFPLARHAVVHRKIGLPFFG